MKYPHPADQPTRRGQLLISCGDRLDIGATARRGHAVLVDGQDLLGDQAGGRIGCRSAGIYRADAAAASTGLRCTSSSASTAATAAARSISWGKLIKATDQKVIVSRRQLDFCELRTVSISSGSSSQLASTPRAVACGARGQVAEELHVMLAPVILVAQRLSRHWLVVGADDRGSPVSSGPLGWQ
jgi:hypothetical protein